MKLNFSKVLWKHLKVLKLNIILYIESKENKLMLSCQSAKVKDAKLHKAKPRTEEVWISKCHWKQFHQQFTWKVIPFDNRSSTWTGNDYESKIALIVIIRYCQAPGPGPGQVQVRSRSRSRSMFQSKTNSKLKFQSQK